MGEGQTETEPLSLDVEIGGLGGDVTLADLFPPAWIQTHCDANSISEFIDSSGFEIDDQESFESIPDHEWDRHVSTCSEFEDWEAMLSAGVEQYVMNNLGPSDAESDEHAEESAEVRA
ncbi:hypothetical protein ACFQJC_00025 [Haloferax namakaokahaiae]|uniref:Uncharacterized protein n=1 Tax=Haloferax namakaokahaiae TaxID=1748331 RepID=A0ABD5Z9I0_9EURY